MDDPIPVQFRNCPLFRRDRAGFDALVSNYIDIVRLSVQESVSGTDQHVFGKLRSLARRAGTQDAVPQDLIAAHLSGLALLVKTQPQARAKAYIRHSRPLLVKLVGELALYYRDQVKETKAQ